MFSEHFPQSITYNLWKIDGSQIYIFILYTAVLPRLLTSAMMRFGRLELALSEDDADVQNPGLHDGATGHTNHGAAYGDSDDESLIDLDPDPEEVYRNYRPNEWVHIVLCNPCNAEIFCINHGDQRRVLFWNRQKCLG